MMDLESIRKEYMQGGLSECRTPDDPFALFAEWLQQAIGAELAEPTAMVVATAASDGMPSARTVLLKGFADGKFIFYTNYQSRKGRQLEGNPRVALLFPWYALERQVHIEGEVSKLPAQVSDAYFDSRPPESRIGAIVSPQSRVIKGRTGLLREFLRLREHIAEGAADNLSGGPVLVRPPHWGGYAVTPQRIEFWQGRENRLHDRILYTLQGDGRWTKQRLAP